MRLKSTNNHIQITSYNDIELHHAHYRKQNFSKHSHEGYAIGYLERGALGFYYRGEYITAYQGMINLVNPDEIHTGYNADEQGWSYRMFYLPSHYLKSIYTDMRQDKIGLPFFKMGIIEDKILANKIYNLHHIIMSNDNNTLEKETKLIELLSDWIIKYSDAPPHIKKIGKNKKPIQQVQEYIRNLYFNDIKIDNLCKIANMSPYHFIRIFKKETGLTPHAFLIQARVNKAKQLLLSGKSISDVAYITGFSDQSHLNRNFKKILGLTPYQFSSQISM